MNKVGLDFSRDNLLDPGVAFAIGDCLVRGVAGEELTGPIMCLSDSAMPPVPFLFVDDDVDFLLID